MRFGKADLDQSPGNFVLSLFGLTFLYTAAAYLGLNWAQVAGAGSPVWPASGVALAGLLLGGLRLWPAILIGRLAAAWLSGSGQPLWADLSIAVANTLGTVVPLLLIRRAGGIDLRLSSLRDLLKYLLWGALAGALISATLGTLTLTASSELSTGAAARVFMGWSVGNFVGSLVLGPLLLAWFPKRGERKPTVGSQVHLATMLVATATISWMVFVWDDGGILRTWHVFPVMVWAAIAFHLRGATAAALIVAAVASWATSRGLGPIASISGIEGLQIPLVQQFIATTTLTMLILAVVAGERRGKEEATQRAQRAQEAEDDLRRVMDQLFAFVGLTTLDGTLLRANRAPLAAGGLDPSDVIGKPFWETYWWSYSPAVQARLRDAIRRAAEGEAVRYEVQVRLAGGALATVDFQVAPLRDAAGTITHLIPSGVLIEDRIRAEAERKRLAAVLEATPDFVGVADARGGTLYLNPAARVMVGIPFDAPVEGTHISAYCPPHVYKMLVDVALPAAAKLGTWQGESALNVAGGEPVPMSQLIIAHKNEAGDVEFYSTIARDLSEQKKAEEREMLLAREVDHRSKNLLGVVQSVVHLANAPDVTELKQAITGRVQSLARTHSLLAASRWDGADLFTLIADELEAYSKDDPSRVRIKGPPVRLKPAAAQAFALVIHELRTNAAKYGCLSNAEGHLKVTWLLPAVAQEKARLRLRWEERGGPLVSSPTKRGFGSTVIRTSIERQLGGKLKLDWQSSGLVCDIQVPLENVVGISEGNPAGAGREDFAELSRDRPPLTGRRVLVVEDESMIALQIEQALDEAGCTIVGPAARVLDALDLLETTEVDAALLDINVAGEPSFPVADMLMSRGVPFAFCTGYAGTSVLPSRYTGVALIAKPFTPANIIEAVEALGSGRISPMAATSSPAAT